MARRYIENNIDKYIHSLYGHEYRDFLYIYHSCQDKKEIQISPRDGKIIKMLSQLIGANLIVEIGTFMGYSTAWLGSSLKNKHGKLFSFEKNTNYFKRALTNLHHLSFYPQIHLINQKIENNLHNILDHQSIDLLFIDGRKRDYSIYLDYCKPFIKIGGVVIIDNTLSTNNSYMNSEIVYLHKFNKKMSENKEFETTIVPTSNGMTIGVKKKV